MENLLVSFSSGETSAYMAKWLWENKKHQYNMVFVFANTGVEHIKSLIFALKCSYHFGFKLHIVEAVVDEGNRKVTTHKEVSFKSLTVGSQLFEDMIEKYGIPNKKYPHCTRELKIRPIDSFAKEVFNGEPYLKAIGMREDEMDRINEDYENLGIIYPLITMRPMTKAKINFWFSQQQFRLTIKGYEGNCVWCWKKSDKKLLMIARDTPEHFEAPLYLETKFKYHIPRTQFQTLAPRSFFRHNGRAIDILRDAKDFKNDVTDDRLEIDDTESCEIYSNCGDL